MFFLRPISILLLFGLLLSTSSNLVVYLGFKTNQEYIAKQICENRNNPQLHCNGKCYLIKKLKQAQDKEQRQEQQSQKSPAQNTVAHHIQIFKRYAFAEIEVYVPFSMGMPKSIKNSVFHPPQNG